MRPVRSFVAIECPHDVQAEIHKIQQELKMAIEARSGYLRMSWAKPEGIHLTLKFLGDVQEEKIPQIVGAIRAVAEPFRAFHVEIGGVGVFPDLRSPRVIWVGAKSAGDDLVRLQGGIDRALDPLGFPGEDRAFHPHLTLGRVKTDRVKAKTHSIGEAISKWQTQNQERGCGQFEVREVLLMRSDLHPGGAVYTPLAKMGLAVKK